LCVADAAAIGNCGAWIKSAKFSSFGRRPDFSVDGDSFSLPSGDLPVSGLP
jgi:hypothetical protein